jgi:hypothetical protein
MLSSILSGVIAFIAAIIGALITLYAQRQRNRHERSLHEDTHKTEHMAEATALFYLKNSRYTDRSFEHLKKDWADFRKTSFERFSSEREPLATSEAKTVLSGGVS